MSTYEIRKEDGSTFVVVASIPTEDIIVKSTVDYIPQYVTDVYGKTERVTKDVTLARLIGAIQERYPDHTIVSIGTPVNFDVAPTHLTRVEMQFENEEQLQACLKEISVSDMLIRSRVQPAWDWQMPIANPRERHVVLHVGWYDTVYFMQYKDIFLSKMHCRYSAKFGFDPREASIAHFRYDDMGNTEEIEELNAPEEYADSIKEKVEFLRVFRDGTTEST